MPDPVTGLVEDIKVLTTKMAKAEGNAVLHVIELARLYVELRQSVKKRQWERTLTELGVSLRVASRYLVIGESWWLQDPPGSDELTLLPCDLEKLEQLSKLSPHHLPVVLQAVRCKEVSRGAVISAVQRVLGGKPPAPADDEVTVKSLKKKLSGYVRRFVNVIEELREEDLDAQARQDLWGELQAEFSEVEAALYSESSRRSHLRNPTRKRT